MRVPKPVKPGDTIGLTSPSSDVQESMSPRLEAAIKRLREQGFQVKEGACLRGGTKGISTICPIGPEKT